MRYEGDIRRSLGNGEEICCGCNHVFGRHEAMQELLRGWGLHAGWFCGRCMTAWRQTHEAPRWGTCDCCGRERRLFLAGRSIRRGPWLCGQCVAHELAIAEAQET